MMNGSTKGEYHLTATDGRNIIIILILYGLLSFFHLGNISAPQTFWSTEELGSEAVLDLGEVRQVSFLRQLTGARFGKFKLAISDDNMNYSEIGDLEQNKVFAWQDVEINQSFRYLAIIEGSKKGAIGEVSLYDSNGNRLSVIALNEEAQLIIDEQDKVPGQINYMNTTYFDEIYHARTAYEYIHGMKIYEWTHPPLGKLIMTIPIWILGMTPFAYRVMGNLIGILMLLIIYVFAKRMYRNTTYATLAMLLFAADGMHFVQTRIGTVDSYLVCFIMLAYLFMYQYTCDDAEKEPVKIHLNLLGSGFFMGCAMATKWNGCYTAIGLGIIFFINFLRRNSHMRFSSHWRQQRLKVFLACFVYFIFIPIIIYIASYIPDMMIDPRLKTVQGFINLQLKMYHYHADLVATHPFSSPWYMWPIGMKPLWYYDGKVADGMVSSITLHSNPFIWWTGILAMLYYVFKAVSDRSKNYYFIVIAILAAYMPYIGVPRIMFLYHYFPVVPLMILAITGTIKDIEENLDQKSWWKWYAGISIAVFAFFYPIYSGLLIPEWYAHLMRWFPAWILFRSTY